MHNLKHWAVALSTVCAAGAGQAALIDRGGGMIYDSTRNLTWLADMNFAVTSGYTAGGSVPETNFSTDAIWTNGRMGRNAAIAWASSLAVGGFHDWRLPTLNPLDTTCSTSFNSVIGVQYSGFHCTGGELSGLFVTELGNKPGESVLDQNGDSDTQKANLALFKNVQSGYYWSGTEPAQAPGYGWNFRSSSGEQDYATGSFPMFAVAVRSGDVLVSASVPEPQTLVLVLVALGVGLAARRKQPD